MKLSQPEAKEYCQVYVRDQELNFFVPNGPCLWRVKTLLSKEPWTLEWIDSFSEDDIFWDVGANVGIYTIYAAVMKNVKTFAFEPESSNYRVLNENIRINSITKSVRSYCIAISDKHDFIDLRLSKIETGSSNHQIRPKKGAVFIQGCVAYSLDELCEYLPRPTKLKIDVDGIEPFIIKGSMNVALDSVESLMVELYSGSTPNMINTYEVIRPMLEQKGFTWVKEVADRSVHKGGQYEGMGEHLFTR